MSKEYDQQSLAECPEQTGIITCAYEFIFIAICEGRRPS